MAGSNQEDYLVQGFTESEDRRRGWSVRRIFAKAEEKMFDFCVTKTIRGYEAVYSKVWLGKAPAPAETGLWWCKAEVVESDLSQWSKPMQIMTAEDRQWHAGPWKPSLPYKENADERIFVFFDGIYKTAEAGPFGLFGDGPAEVSAREHRRDENPETQVQKTNLGHPAVLRQDGAQQCCAPTLSTGVKPLLHGGN